MKTRLIEYGGVSIYRLQGAIVVLTVCTAQEIPAPRPLQHSDYLGLSRHGCADYRHDVDAERALLPSVREYISLVASGTTLMFCTQHPVAYLAKLNIEMAMSTLIIKVARETGVNVDEDSTTNKADTTGQRGTNSMQVSVQITRTQHREDIELTDQSPRVWSTTTQKPDLAGSPKSSVELGLDMGVRKDRFD